MTVKFDHCVVHVSDWMQSNDFYARVLGADVVEVEPGRYAYRFGDVRLNLHGPGVTATPVAARPVLPGNSDLCFQWPGPIADAVEHLRRVGVEIELGPVDRAGVYGQGRSVYFRDPDGSLLELLSYDA